MPDPFCADELVRKVLNISGLTAEKNNLKARIMIQMGMQSGNDHFVMLMLKVCELFRKKAGVMIVDQSHGPHDCRSRGYNRSSYKLLADQVAKCLGSVVISFFSKEFVKAIEQIRF